MFGAGHGVAIRNPVGWEHGDPVHARLRQRLPPPAAVSEATRQRSLLRFSLSAVQGTETKRNEKVRMRY